MQALSKVITAIKPTETTGRQVRAVIGPPSSAHHAQAAPRNAKFCKQCEDWGRVTLDVPIGDPRFGKAVPCSKCEMGAWYQERQMQGVFRRSGLAEASRKARLSHYRNLYPGVVESLYEFLQHGNLFGDDGRCYPWLVVFGPNGSGKTFITSALATVYMGLGYEVLYSSIADLMDDLRDGYRDDTFTELFLRARNVQVLFLDEVGGERSSDWSEEKLTQLLSWRETNGLPVISTSNIPPWKLVEEMGDNWAWRRIMARLADNSFPVLLEGYNLRGWTQEDIIRGGPRQEQTP